MEMARIINDEIKAGRGPEVLLIQEGFRPETKELIAALNFPYVIQGPKDSDKNPIDKQQGIDKKSDAILGAGLWILSRYPITKSGTIAFGASRCTGYDCYANKGIAYVQIQVPGVGPVDILNTHMNSKGSSGSSDKKVFETQKKQLEIVRYYYDRMTSKSIPAIFAGDFNITTERPNYPDLHAMLPMYNAGLFCEAYQYFCKIGPNTTAKELHVSRDQHFYRAGTTWDIHPIYAIKNMREKVGDRILSDHEGYLVTYRFTKK